MALIHAFLSLLLSLIVLFGSCQISFANHPENLTILTRNIFPKDFVIGASSSAYQYEGATNVDGRGQSIWDTFVHEDPDIIEDGSNADVALDFYNRFQDDINLMKDIGLQAFRLSISWTRVIPTGKLSDGVNPKGIAFYNNVINGLVAHGIQPFVTIFHWDLPEQLQKEYGGFLSPRITKDYLDFAELCFKEFGDRVKHWATINEPWNVASFGYDLGSAPPNRCSRWKKNNCAGGDSATEPYIVTHNILISHGQIVDLYKTNYKPHQKGEIGIVLNPYWFVPYSNDDDDIEAAQRALDFQYGWFLDPLVHGEYPKSMQRLVGNRLPKFTHEQITLVKGSLDFLGINYYTSKYARNRITNTTFDASSRLSMKSYGTDAQVEQTSEKDGKPIGDPTGYPHFFVYPHGLYEILKHTSDNYHNIPTYITECGYAETDNDILDPPEIEDDKRVEFYKHHFKTMTLAINHGANVKGFFAWSFLDTWEWGSGFKLRFGLTFVDYKNNLKRELKHSAKYFKKVIFGLLGSERAFVID